MYNILLKGLSPKIFLHSLKNTRIMLYMRWVSGVLNGIQSAKNTLRLKDGLIANRPPGFNLPKNGFTSRLRAY